MLTGGGKRGALIETLVATVETAGFGELTCLIFLISVTHILQEIRWEKRIALSRGVYSDSTFGMTGKDLARAAQPAEIDATRKRRVQEASISGWTWCSKREREMRLVLFRRRPRGGSRGWCPVAGADSPQC